MFIHMRYKSLYIVPCLTLFMGNSTFIQIRRLELEREQLLSTIEALKTRHRDELASIDSSHK